MRALPALATGWEAQPFEGGGREDSWLLSGPEGGRWHVNGRTLELIEALHISGSLDDAARWLSRRWGMDIAPDALDEYVRRHLAGLAGAAGPAAARRAPPERQPRGRLSSLSLRVTLVPARVLSPLARLAVPLVHPRIFAPLLIASAAAATGWAWSGLRGEALLAAMASPAAVGLFVLSTFAHELGHAAACRCRGCRHGALGFGLYLAFPVLYMEVDDSWTLSRRGRAAVDLAGVHVQLLFGLALLAAAGPLGIEPLAAGTMGLIVLGVVGTLNPILRFDGYWLASDLLGVPNLRAKSVDALSALARGRAVPQFVPGGMPAGRRLAFLVYAVVGTAGLVWILGMLLLALPRFVMDVYPERMRSGWLDLYAATAAVDPLAALAALLAMAVPTAVVAGTSLLAVNLVRARRGRRSHLL